MYEKAKVALARCAPETADADVMQRTIQMIEQLPDWAAPFAGARTIAVKINAGVDRLVLTHGKQTELTEPAVVEGAICALRRVTDAEILVGDATTSSNSWELYHQLGLPERLQKYSGVRLVDFNASELVEVPMMHPQRMFAQYMLPRELVEADVFVSLAKMKAHSSMGFTLCTKNLFGWMPTKVYGAPRMYLHDRLIRLPRVLSDLAQWTRPALNVVDGIVAASKSEWGGEAVCPGVLLAGTNIVATDSVGARVMGFDPNADFPNEPFFYRHNPLKLMAAAGLGDYEAEQIEVLGPQPEDIATRFEVKRYRGNTEREEQLRRGAACVAAYQEQQELLAQRFSGRFLALRDGEVLWDGPNMQSMMQQERASGRDWQNAPQLVVRCLPADEEIEEFAWYEHDAGVLATA